MIVGDFYSISCSKWVVKKNGLNGLSFVSFHFGKC